MQEAIESAEELLEQVQAIESEKMQQECEIEVEYAKEVVVATCVEQFLSSSIFEVVRILESEGVRITRTIQLSER